MTADTAPSVPLTPEQQTQQARAGLLYIHADLEELAARCPARADTLTALAEVTACVAEGLENGG